MDPEKNTKSINTVIFSLITIVLLTFAIFDFTITQPKIRNNVKTIAVEFDSMKVYLDDKLPEIDSALTQHQKAIAAQTKYLEELNTISLIFMNN